MAFLNLYEKSWYLFPWPVRSWKAHLSACSLVCLPYSVTLASFTFSSNKPRLCDRALAFLSPRYLGNSLPCLLHQDSAQISPPERNLPQRYCVKWPLPIPFLTPLPCLIFLHSPYHYKFILYACLLFTHLSPTLEYKISEGRIHGIGRCFVCPCPTVCCQPPC